MKKLKTLIWLDDTRNPFENNWLVFSPIDQPYNVIWVKQYEEFVNYIIKNGLPEAICFDHDLGLVIDPNSEFKTINGEISSFSLNIYDDNEKTGYDCAKFLVDYCIDNNLNLPLYNIQSANPVGKENIDSLLKNYNKFKIEQNDNI
jgi:hypothetical protein